MNHDFDFGPCALTSKQSRDHYLIAGATGSGKTRILLTVLKSAHRHLLPSRSFILDPKRELLKYLLGLGYRFGKQPDFKKSLWVVNPFDLAGSSWAMGRDITDAVAAHELATILVPHIEGRDNAFFDAATRDILVGATLALAAFTGKPHEWTLRDLLLTCLYPGYQRFMLVEAARATSPSQAVQAYTTRIYRTYLEGADTRTVDNVKASVQSRLSLFEPAAARWALLPHDQSFSLTEWVARGGTLLVSTDDAARAATDPLVRAVFSRASSLVLSMEDIKPENVVQDRTWFFLDEVRDAGRLDLLPRVLLKGRSKGVSVVLSFQDIDGLREVYGPHVANEMVGQCGNLALLRLSSPATAQWAASNFGRRHDEVHTRTIGRNVNQSVGHPQQGLSEAQTESTQLQEVAKVLDSRFLYMPTVEESGAIKGLYRALGESEDTEPEDGLAWTDHLGMVPTPPEQREQEKILESWLGSRRGQKPGIGLLRLWDESDMERLGLEGNPPEAHLAPSNGDADDDRALE